jgi:hypothetical protein
MVKVLGVAEVGVPLKTPVVAFRAKPAGSVPADTDQVYAFIPPLAANVVVLKVPTVYAGRAAVVIVRVATTGVRV